MKLYFEILKSDRIGIKKDEIKKFECDKLAVKIQKILDYICLDKRASFLIPPEGFRKEDTYPWRFNRELSFTRRPLIKRDNEYIWGNRNIK